MDTKALIATGTAFDLNDFRTTVIDHIAVCKKTLMEEYFYAVTDVFLQGSKRKKLPEPSKPKKMKSFYNAVAAIMTGQLQELCLKSLYDYVNYILDIKYKNQGFIVNLVMKVNALGFDPSFKNIQHQLLNMLELIQDAVMDIPRLETKLYLDYAGEEEFLKVGM